MNLNQKSVAILYVCTGQYVVFWKEFYESSEKYFLGDGFRIEYFVFTDAVSVYDSDINERIHIIEQKNLGWPGNTLMRYDMFWRRHKLLEDFDYIFFMNSNAEFVSKINADDILPEDDEIVAVQHPGTLTTHKYLLPYERNKKSTAYIPYEDGIVYVAGGINGGTGSAFLKMTKVLKERIDKDLNNGIVAVWHDESQFNRYICYDTESRILSPSFCYPEGWTLSYKPIILIREKSRYFNVKKVKRNSTSIILSGIKRHAIYASLIIRDAFRGR